MRVLGLETSSFHGSIAAAEGGNLLHSELLPTDRRTAQSLAPAIDRMLRALNWQVSDLDLIAVTVGPGSFTGLRIGVTTAKTLAYAAKAKVIGINTLEALAVAADDELPIGESVLPMVDAHRGEFFTTRYRKIGTAQMEAASEVEIVSIDQWLKRPPPEEWLTGPLLPKLADEINANWPDAKLCDSSLWTPSAAAVVRIAERLAEEGKFEDLYALVPKYYRPSYAEEKRSK